MLLLSAVFNCDLAVDLLFPDKMASAQMAGICTTTFNFTEEKFIYKVVVLRELGLMRHNNASRNNCLNI